MSDAYIISNENDAYDLLQKLDNKDVELEEPIIEFSGWPILEIKLEGKEFNSTITPPLMRSFLEYQKSI